MATVHVVGYDEENWPDQSYHNEATLRLPIWLVGRTTPYETFEYGDYVDPTWVDGSYSFTEAMDLARERDNQWNPGVSDD
jgi:hypothetical protein